MKLDWLKDITIILTSHYIPGSLAALILRYMGARVIKIEPPSGEYMRKVPPFFSKKNGQKQSAYFRALNEGFESIAINLKDPSGAIILEKFIKKSDILIDGNRPNHITKILGKNISDINSNIVHIPITAHGLSGPYEKITGHDGNLLALSGVTSFNSITSHGTPAMTGVQICDIVSGYMAAILALGHLVGKMNSKSDVNIKTIDTSMLDNAMYLAMMYVTAMNVTNQPPKPEKEILNGGAGNYNTYFTKDHKPVFFGPIEEKLFDNFCNAIGRIDLKTKRTSQSGNKLIKEIETIINSHTSHEWRQILAGVDCCFTFINNLDDAFEDLHIQKRNIINDVHDDKIGKIKSVMFPAVLDGKRLDNFSSAPDCSEHANAILKWAGYSDVEITELIRNKVVVQN